MKTKYIEEFSSEFIFESSYLWLTQKQIAKIFNVTLSTINEHISSLDKSVSGLVGRFKTTKKEGSRCVSRERLHYRIDLVYSLSIKTNRVEESALIYDVCSRFKIPIVGFRAITIKERDFMNVLLESLSGVVKIEPQYKCGNRFIDFFIPEYNLAIEYDEPHHRKIKNKSLDELRESEIKGEIKGVSFIRVNSGSELKGLNEIIKFIFSEVSNGK